MYVLLFNFNRRKVEIPCCSNKLALILAVKVIVKYLVSLFGLPVKRQEQLKKIE